MPEHILVERLLAASLAFTKRAFRHETCHGIVCVIIRISTVCYGFIFPSPLQRPCPLFDCGLKPIEVSTVPGRNACSRRQTAGAGLAGCPLSVGARVHRRVVEPREDVQELRVRGLCVLDSWCQANICVCAEIGVRLCYRLVPFTSAMSATFAHKYIAMFGVCCHGLETQRRCPLANVCQQSFEWTALS